MDWITAAIAIGNHIEARDVELLAREGIRAVVSLDGAVTSKDAALLGVTEIASYRLIDGPGNDLRVFQFALADLRRLMASSPPVLVHCHAGRSRSPTLVAAYLMSEQGLEPEEAVAFIAARREINIAPELTELLHRMETRQ